MRIIGLAVALFCFWLLLSGHTTNWLIGAGAVTAILVALFGRRAGYADEEGFPLERVTGGVFYLPWLVVEIAKSALTVTGIILRPALPIAPRLVRVPAPQRTAVGLATYANSITLTPGTITIEVDRRRRELVVHALTAARAESVAEGEMGRRVARFEGRR
jgi:multicomponent Na+:H+ antiporter subunit E